MSPTSVQQIDAWRAARSETEHLEFKEAKSQFSFDNLLKYCVAIGNEGGGHLLLGISNKPPRPVVGTSAYANTQKTAFDLLNKLHFRVDIDEVMHPDGRVLVFQIPARPFRHPLQVDGTYYMRSGESLVAMTPDQLKRIINERGPELAPRRRRVIVVLISLFLVVLALISLRVIPKKESPKSVESEPRSQGASREEPKPELPRAENPPSKKKVPVKPVRKSEPPAFSVAIEFTFFSGAVEGYNTQFWVVRGPADNCAVFPARIAFYVRIKNLRATPTMITGYVIRSGKKPFLRLKTATDPVVAVFPKGTYKGGNVEKTIQVTQGTGLASFVRFALKDADLAHAFPMELVTLDQQMGDKTIGPSQSIRGLAFFQYPFEGYFLDPRELWADITDDTGEMGSYRIELKNGDPNADTMPRTLTIKNPIDLSSCTVTMLHPEPTGPTTKSVPNLHFGNENTFGMNFGRAWTRRDLPSAAYIAWVIPVTNDLIRDKAIGQADKIKAQVIFSIDGTQISDGSAPWQDEEFNSVSIPVGETKYIVVAVDRIINGQPLGMWFGVTSNSAMQGKTTSFDSKVLSLITDEQAHRKLDRKLEVRLFSDDGKILQTRLYDWTPASGITPLIIRQRPVPSP